jgi:hypothetical protein
MSKLSEKSNSKVAVVGASRTKFVDNAVLQVAVGGGEAINGAPLLAEAYAYKDANGKYRLNFNISYLIVGSGTAWTWSISGITFVADQAVAMGNGAGIRINNCSTGAGNLFGVDTDSAVDRHFFSGDIALISQPSWWDDNLEVEGGIGIATVDTYGVVKQGLVAKKEAARVSRTPGMLTPFQFNNLDIGKHYEYRAILNCAGAVGGEVNLLLNIYSNSAPLATNDWDFQSVSGINYEGVVTISYIWKTQAGQTDVGTQLISMGAGGAAIGGVSFLIERPDLDLSNGYTSDYD